MTKLIRHIACGQSSKAIFVLALLIATVSLWPNAVTSAERPNILFILADDMGWQDTSVPFAQKRTAWNDRYHTPALERLASEGIKFTQAYSCTVPWQSMTGFQLYFARPRPRCQRTLTELN